MKAGLTHAAATGVYGETATEPSGPVEGEAVAFAERRTFTAVAKP